LLEISNARLGHTGLLGEFALGESGMLSQLAEPLTELRSAHVRALEKYGKCR